MWDRRLPASGDLGGHAIAVANDLDLFVCFNNLVGERRVHEQLGH